MAIRAGKMRHKIDVQQLTETRTSTGSLVQGWATIATLRAAIRWVGGGESNRDQVNATNSALFVVRYHSGIIDQKNRVVYNGRNFDIQTVQVVDERNHEIQITAVEYVGN